MMDKACLLLATGLLGVLVGCGYSGDTPPAELVGEWQSYESSDAFFRYYDPATGKWQGNGYYSNLVINTNGGYEQVDILQTGAGTGCPSALHVDRKGGIQLEGNLLTLQRRSGKAIADSCSGRSVNNGPFEDVTFTWSITTQGGRQVLVLGDPADPNGNPQLYDRVR